jgi:hypothetical protein
MPITGNWKEQTRVQAGARIWGSGWNPVHAIPGGDGRNIAPDPNSGPPVDMDVVDLNAPYTTYETDGPSDSIWGAGTQTGTADRPNLGQPGMQQRAHANFPGWDSNGDAIRSQDHGAEALTISKKNFIREALDGWRNKEVTAITDARPSDSSQYVMQTSMTQRDKARTGSQTAGRASTFIATIQSRIIGEKLKTLVGSPDRLSAMFPAQQAFMVRPFWNRNAGTDDPDKMLPNSEQTRLPFQRIAPADPWQGTELVGTTQGYMDTGSWTVSYE